MNADSLTAEAAAGPLAGLRVLDFSTSAAGAQASQTLADFGAEVVQVEPPGGSQLRAQPGYPFLARGKQSIVLDLQTEADRALARTMASGADVVIEAFRPGVMERLGLGYEDLRADNPGLIFGSVTGFGRTGPYAAAKGYEALVMARIGALSASGGMVTRPGPAHVSVPYGSYGASQLLLTGILAALHERRSCGLGQRVDTQPGQGRGRAGHLELVPADPGDQDSPEAFSQRRGRVSDSGVPMSPIFFMLLDQALTKDGRWLQFSQVQLHLYLAMLKVMGLDWVLADEDWEGGGLRHAATRGIGRVLGAAARGAVRERTMAEWQQVFEDHHDVWAARPCGHGSELLGHPADAPPGRSRSSWLDAERGPVRPARSDSAPQTRPPPCSRRTSAAARRGRCRAARQPMARRGRRPLGGPERGHWWRAVRPGPGGRGRARARHVLRQRRSGGTALRELGARVIKVEADQGRADADPAGRSSSSARSQGDVQGKESIAVDMST